MNMYSVISGYSWYSSTSWTDECQYPLRGLVGESVPQFFRLLDLV